MFGTQIDLSQRRQQVIAAAVVLVLAFVSVLIVLLGTAGAPHQAGKATLPVSPASGTVSLPRGAALPAGVQKSVGLLTSADPAAARSVLAPELVGVLPTGAMFPPGAVITLDPTGWYAQGTYASALGSLAAPGQPAQRVVIGFVDRDGTWLVLSESASPQATP